MNNPIAANQMDSGGRIGLIALFLPTVLIIGILAAALFAPILGDQATELATLVQEAEVDLTVYLTGLVSQELHPLEGTLGKLLPKLVLFSLLLIVWCATSSIVTLSVAERIQSRAARLIIATIVSLLLPGALVAKYLAANYVGSLFEPGGLWVFSMSTISIAMVTQFVVGWTYLRSQQAFPTIGYLHFLFGGSILLFVGLSLLFSYGPVRFIAHIGSINLIILYVVLLYAFLAGLVYYSHSRVGSVFVGAAALYVVGVTVVGASIDRAVPSVSSTSKSLEGGKGQADKDQFSDWYANRHGKERKSPFPVFIIASSGGGVRATMRTVAFLEFMKTRCPMFLHHTFAISGVSGGALGALLFAAQQQGQTYSGEVTCNLKGFGTLTDKKWREVTLSPDLDAYFDKDILSGIVSGALFSEMLGRVVPTGVLPGLDRSRILRNLLAANWRDAMEAAGREVVTSSSDEGACSSRDALATCDSETYWKSSGDVPLLIFNTTSSEDGTPVVLSNMAPDFYIGRTTPIGVDIEKGSEDRSVIPFHFFLVDGAGASARYPVALPAALFKDNRGREFRLVDGGYFDDSGLIIARSVKRAVESIIAGGQKDAAVGDMTAKVYLIYLGETYEPTCLWSSESSLLSRLARNGEFAHLAALFNAREKRSFATFQLIQELEGADSIIKFEWPNSRLRDIRGKGGASESTRECEMVLPLAFYYAPRTRKSFQVWLNDGLLTASNSDSLNKLYNLLDQAR